MDEMNSQYPGDPMERPENGAEPRPEETADGEEPAFEMPDDTPLQEQWRFLAEEKGIAEADMLRKLCRSAAKEVGRRCMEESGGDPAGAREAYARYWQARPGRYAGTPAAGGAGTGRSAACPSDGGIRSPADTESFYPGAGRAAAAVLQTAVEEGIPLFDAYLRYEWAERRRAEEERQAAEKAAACSAGRLGDRPDRPAAEQEVFTAVFRAAVK